jgi:hypothetical protein
MLVLVVESVLNGNLLALSNELGLLGGILDAGIISLLNVAWGFAVGRFMLPNLWHRSRARISIGVLGVLAYVLVTCAFNLAVGHYRDALAVGLGGQAILDVAPRTLNDPLALTGFKSWLLVGLGILFSAVALLEGLVWDDCYPGYGAVARRAALQREEFEALYRDLQDDLTIKDACLKEMRQRNREIGRQRDLFDEIIQNRARMHAALRDHLDHLKNALNQLLSVYREANRRARREPVPARFEGRHEPKWAGEPPPPAEQERRTRISAEVERANEELEAWTKEVLEAYEDALDSYARVGGLQKEES